jgi:ankyrin repeat protein
VELSDCRRCKEKLCVADCRRGTGMCLLCRRTALHLASLNGRTKTALTLVKAGADVHCKAYDGYGSHAASSRRRGPHSAGRIISYCPSNGGGVAGVPVWPCRHTALHLASENGHTETALALIKAGADVHYTTNDGSGSRRRILVSVVCQTRGGRSVHSGWSCRGACLAEQGYGASLGVAERPHGDGDGAGRGGRRRALQGRFCVRFLGPQPRVFRLPQCGADGASTRGGAAGVHVWLCSRTALHLASENGHTETEMALVEAGAEVHCENNDG